MGAVTAACARSRLARHAAPLLLSVVAAGAAATPCATTIGELKAIADDTAFPLRWQETSMSDGKPLVVAIAERDDTLFLEFTKTREGLWAEGSAKVCGSGAVLEARLRRGGLRLGPAAHWILRHSIGPGAVFVLSRLPDGQLRIATPGWSGLFVPLHDGARRPSQ